MTEQIDTNNLIGLNDQEVMENLAKYGYNELPTAKKKSFLKILLDVIKEPMFLLLIACGILYLILGDLQESIMLLIAVFVVIGITLYQEQKTERALEALKDLSSPRALVIRNGIQQRIAGREVVTNDLIIIREGDRVPADAVILTNNNLNIDESLLTGESMPVLKKNWDGVQKDSPPGGNDLPFVYSGTMVVKGQAICQVKYIGIKTEMGKIGKALQTLEIQETNLKKEIKKIVKTFATVGLFLCSVVVVVYGITRQDWLNGLLAGITMAMSVLPEEFPVILTIFLALGAWRISQKKVLTRQVPAVEMLGATTVLCVDKTGTLTLNHMAISKIGLENEIFDVDMQQISLPEKLHQIIEYSILSSSNNPFDPMEKAIKELGGRTLINTEHLHQNWTLLKEYPLSDKLLAMSSVWQAKDGENYTIAAKGAPEAILELCHANEEELKKIHKQIEKMADLGLRIIAVAKANFQKINLPKEQHDFNFEFLGLLGLADPIRPEVPEAVAECYTAGIKIIMITGDYPGTALNIAKQIGLNPLGNIITGYELNKMNDLELEQRIKNTCIFARVVPEQKLRIVNALKNNGEVVAMTGDGVNDAPALKSAHIGIAMGGRGTDVARESSSIVLLDDNFSSIVAAIKMGRRIFDNLKKAMLFTFSVHIPIAGMSLLPVIFKWPLALLPIHILFLELIIDPACSIVFEMEKEEKNIMNRPPRKLSESLFSKALIIKAFIQGTAVLIVSLGIYYYALNKGLVADEARVFAFTNLVIGNLGLILTNMSTHKFILSTLKHKNYSLWIVSFSALTFLFLALKIDFLQKLFHFSQIKLWELGVCLLVAIIPIIISESIKIRWIKKFLN